MKRTTVTVARLACLACLGSVGWVFAGTLFHRYPVAMLTIKAVDEDAVPLPDMPVRVWLAEDPVRVGKTDRNGLFVVKGECTFKDVPIGIVKSGYYPTDFKYEFPDFIEPSAPRWEPWNPIVTAVVRRVVNPIPMYAKRVEAIIPTTNTLCGFDLMVGDWIEPYGKGVCADLPFEFGRRFTRYEDYEERFILLYTNRLDGIATVTNSSPQSKFRLPRYAYEAGYEQRHLFVRGNNPKTGRFGISEPREDYFVRLRSVIDEKGHLKQAYYGKLIGGIDLAGAGTAKFRVLFTYYLNPTPNDRNLEFDPNRNLFTNLGEFETVSQP